MLTQRLHTSFLFTCPSHFARQPIIKVWRVHDMTGFFTGLSLEWGHIARDTPIIMGSFKEVNVILPRELVLLHRMRINLNTAGQRDAGASAGLHRIMSWYEALCSLYVNYPSYPLVRPRITANTSYFSWVSSTSCPATPLPPKKIEHNPSHTVPVRQTASNLPRQNTGR